METPSPLFPAELFILVGINVFVALSLLTSLFDGPFPKAVPYFYQIAALAGFGQIWVSYAFLFFLVESRFWCSLLYLVVALINVVAFNLYIAINKRLLNVAGVFLGVATIPTIFTSFLSVSAYVNGSAIAIPPLPIVPAESLYMVLITCIFILGLSVLTYFEPHTLRKTFGRHQKRVFVPSLLDYVASPMDDPEENEKGGEKNDHRKLSK
jgi:hypothetical protein